MSQLLKIRYSLLCVLLLLLFCVGVVVSSPTTSSNSHTLDQWLPSVLPDYGGTPIESTDEHLLVWLYSPIRDLHWRLQHWQVKTELKSVDAQWTSGTLFLFLLFSSEVPLS